MRLPWRTRHQPVGRVQAKEEGHDASIEKVDPPPRRIIASVKDHEVEIDDTPKKGDEWYTKKDKWEFQAIPHPDYQSPGNINQTTERSDSVIGSHNDRHGHGAAYPSIGEAGRDHPNSRRRPRGA